MTTMTSFLLLMMGSLMWRPILMSRLHSYHVCVVCFLSFLPSASLLTTFIMMNLNIVFLRFSPSTGGTVPSLAVTSCSGWERVNNKPKLSHLLLSRILQYISRLIWGSYVIDVRVFVEIPVLTISVYFY